MHILQYSVLVRIIIEFNLRRLEDEYASLNTFIGYGRIRDTDSHPYSKLLKTFYGLFYILYIGKATASIIYILISNSAFRCTNLITLRLIRLKYEYKTVGLHNVHVCSSLSTIQTIYCTLCRLLADGIASLTSKQGIQFGSNNKILFPLKIG